MVKEGTALFIKKKRNPGGALVPIYIWVGEVRVGIRAYQPQVPRHIPLPLLCRVLSSKLPVPKNQTHKLEMIRAPKLKNTRVKRSRQNARKSNYKSIVPSRIVRTDVVFLILCKLRYAIRDLEPLLHLVHSLVTSKLEWIV